MKTYKVTYEYVYPECGDDIRISYVLAKDFRDAQHKVEKNKKGEHETAYIKSIELLEAEIFI